MTLVAFTGGLNQRRAWFMDDDDELSFFAAQAFAMMGGSVALNYAIPVYFEMNKRNVIDALNYPTTFGYACAANQIFGMSLGVDYHFALGKSGCFSGMNMELVDRMFTVKSPRKKGRHG